MVHHEGDEQIAVGTVQGLRTDTFEGGIQNLGIVPGFRDRGLGGALLFHALDGFAAVGCQMAHLEVTVQNTAALRLYQRLGFRRTETVFKVAAGLDRLMGCFISPDETGRNRYNSLASVLDLLDEVASIERACSVGTSTVEVPTADLPQTSYPFFGHLARIINSGRPDRW